VEGKTFGADTLAQLLVDEYGISMEIAKNDVTPLLETWTKAGVIED
jgi:hypothetical protein